MIDKKSFVPWMIAAALALSGCVGAQDDPVEPASTEDAMDSTAPTETPFAKDGMIGPAAYVCPLVGCVGGEPMSDRTWDAPFEGTLVAANLTLTWDAMTPATQDLVVGLAHGPADARKYELTSGPSPLELTVDGLTLTKGDDVRVFVWVPTPLMVAAASTPQAFHVEGVLVGAP